MGGRRRDRARSNGRRPYLSKCRVCRRARLAATHAHGVIAHVVAHNRTALAGRAATLGRGCGIEMRAAAPPGCQRLSTGRRRRECAARSARRSAQSSGHNCVRGNATTRRHTRSGGCSGGGAHAPRVGTRTPAHTQRGVQRRRRTRTAFGHAHAGTHAAGGTCARANALGISGLRGGGTMGRGVERSVWGDLDGQSAGLHTAARPVCRAQTLPRARLCRARGQPRACELAVRTTS